MLLTFITGNESKARELGWHLRYPVNQQKLDLREIQSLDLKEIIEQKAREAYKQIGSPVLVEDTSLKFIALGNLPGPLIKWFLEELGNKGLCQLLDSYKTRRALAEVCFGLYDGKSFQAFEGKMKGVIAKYPKGSRGFGWDPIFIPEGSYRTWGEMTDEEKQKTSMRRIALKKLENFLKNK
ncbi:non-canonical purine NTP pyrophosphatase [Candidatus Wolfebacteria bacterium]|nr:non-canonical purine NTP pyrophosphatase [Candidatus Wolfebacteria bacterium]